MSDPPPRRRPADTANAKKLDALAATFDESDDESISDEEARDEVARLGTDIPALAAALRAKVAAADTNEGAHASNDDAARQRRIDDARRGYAAELERIERRKNEPIRDRVAQLATFRALLAKAPAGAVSMHFHKYEAATDEELAELVRALRHLLGEEDTDSDRDDERDSERGDDERDRERDDEDER